jgi:hypothetical protein
MSADQDEKSICVSPTRGRMAAGEHETLGPPVGRARGDRPAGAAADALAIPLQDDLDRGRHDPLDDVLAARAPETLERAPRTQHEDDGTYRHLSHSESSPGRYPAHGTDGELGRQGFFPLGAGDRTIARAAATEGGMKDLGQPIGELDVEPLLYPAALPKAPAEPTPASVPTSALAEVPA